MKYFILAMMLVFSSTAFGWTQTAPLPVTSCNIHNPYGFPVSATKVTPICRTGYFVGYDAASKIPNFVTYTATPKSAAGCLARANSFTADQSVANGATPADYAHSGFDKGHASPAGDQASTQQTENESFLMTNMYPQAGSLNRGIWKLLETSVRDWTIERNQTFTMYIGALYDNTDGKIGHGVVVPHSFYKIVINDNTHEVAAWQFPHVKPYKDLGNDLTKFRVPVSSIMNATHIKYSFPVDYHELPVGKEWPTNFANLTKSKHASCSIK